MEAFRESRPRRAARQARTVARAVRAGRARAKAAPPLPEVDGPALRALLAEAAADARLVDVPVKQAPWHPTGVSAAEGEQLTWLAWGRLVLIKPLGTALPARASLRVRVGDGPLQVSPRETFTFAAERAGDVRIGSLLPGEMRDDGTVATDRVPHRAMSGRIQAVVVRWPEGTDPREELDRLAPRDPSGLCAAEAARLADPPGPPPGWEHHPLTAYEDIFAATDAGIAAHFHESAGIVRRPADVPLTPTLRLRWTWRMDQLPSSLPEDTPLTHDYLSVALEFDDGQDLTWHWSCGLPVGFAYRCPLEHWRRRETHVVARSGTADVGRWVEDERPVLADHQVAIGGPAPQRVVQAWLIALTMWQGGEGRGEFGRIELVDGDRVTRVL